METERIIKNALKRHKAKERGLSIVQPNEDLANSHFNKAQHDLVVMNDLAKLKHEDWVIISGYYSMYHGAMAILAKLGLSSKDHTTTAAILELCFNDKLGNFVDKFNKAFAEKEKIELTISKKQLKSFFDTLKLRETAQYSIKTSFSESKEVVENSREFVLKLRELSENIDNKLIDFLRNKIKELGKWKKYC